MMRSALLVAVAVSDVRAQGTYNGQSCADALSSMSDELNAACCSPTSNCAGGFPVQCSQHCADVWLPFRRHCNHFLSSQPGLHDLGQACHQTVKVDSEPTDPQICPNGYHQHGDNCYLLSLDRATYSTAMRACETLGGELACINDEEENSFLTSLLLSNDDFWIGLNDRDVDNTFQWANKQCTSDYRNWMQGEPNNAANGLAGDPDCVRMCPSDASPGYVDGSCHPGEWADYACPAENHYVCEIRGCPAGWIAHGGSCYAGFTSPPGSGGPESGATWNVRDQKSHDEAAAACTALGATLVHIDDAAENAWIASMLPPLGTDDYWLGAMNQDTDGRTPESNLAWQGDEGGAAPDTGGYSNWFPGEPNNAGGGVNYDAGESACVRMCPFGDSGGYDPSGRVHCTRGGWADYPCSTPYRYICEKWWNDAFSADAFNAGGHH